MLPRALALSVLWSDDHRKPSSPILAEGTQEDGKEKQSAFLPLWDHGTYEHRHLAKASMGKVKRKDTHLVQPCHFAIVQRIPRGKKEPWH